MATQTMEKKQNSGSQIAPRGERDFWGELDQIRESINQWFRGFPTQIPRPMMAEEFPFPSSPALNMFQEGDNLVVEAQLPGFDKKDIEVNVNQNVLSIKAEREQRKEEKKEGYYMREHSLGSMHRTIRLPMDVNNNKVKAVCRDGVLRVEMPMVEPQRHKSVKVDIK